MKNKIFLLILAICPMKAMQREQSSLKDIPSLKFLAGKKVADHHISLTALPEELKLYTGWIKSNCVGYNYDQALFHAIQDDNLEIIPDLIATGADLKAEHHALFCTPREFAEHFEKQEIYLLLKKYEEAALEYDRMKWKNEHKK